MPKDKNHHHQQGGYRVGDRPHSNTAPQHAPLKAALNIFPHLLSDISICKQHRDQMNNDRTSNEAGTAIPTPTRLQAMPCARQGRRSHTAGHAMPINWLLRVP